MEVRYAQEGREEEQSGMAGTVPQPVGGGIVQVRHARLHRYVVKWWKVS